MSSSPVKNTKPCPLDISFRGHIEGLTYLSPDDSSPLCHYFGGLPYALPPVGPYRWRLPRSLPPCYRYGTRANPGRFVGGAGICPQPGYNGPPDIDNWDEDCLQLDIWMPAGKQPEKGWPVLFYIHGGFLQFGTPNSNNLSALLSETACNCIVVMPAYRLNLFGFLASREVEQEATKNGEPVGNWGFWDQRLALEWTHKNISYFGGDASNITIGGHSAGAHSAFHQLSHDIFLPSNRRLVRRALLISNGPGMQPKSIQSVQDQFDALLSALDIPLHLSATEKLAKLRSLPPESLIAGAAEINLHEFRACADISDGAFIRRTLFEDLDSGAYARQLVEAGVEIVMGEVKDERHVYATWRPPTANTYAALRERLHADYPMPAVDAVLSHCYCPNKKLPTRWGKGAVKDWQKDAFGRIYADLQVHALERGFVDALEEHGAGQQVRRYRIEWRAELVGRSGVPKEWGVTHGTDMTGIWFWGNGLGGGLNSNQANSKEGQNEKEIVKRFAVPVWQWICAKGWGSEEDWGTNRRSEARLLQSDGSTGVWKDEDWIAGVKVWKVAREATKQAQESGAKL